MTNTYLLEVIKAMQPNKRQEMALFLASPFFNRGKNAQEIIQLYQVILEAILNFPDALSNKNRMYFLIFSDSNIEPGRLEKLISDLNKLLRTYALIQQYFSESNEDLQQIEWSKWLRVHGLAETSRKTLLKLKSKKEQRSVESLEHYRTDLMIAEEEHEWHSAHNQFKSDLSIPKLIYDLDLYYHNYRTELENRYLLQQKGMQLSDLPLTKDVGFYQEESSLLQISKNIFEVLRRDIPSVGEFKGLMRLLKSCEAKLSFETLAQFYAYLRNACTLLINNGHEEFLSTLHEIHKDNLDRGYFFVNGKTTPNAYVNLGYVAIRANEIAWAKGFTEKYQHGIIGGDPDQFFYHFNMARCLFAEGKFDEALSQMPEAPSSSHYHHMVRRLELKIYYELGSDLLSYKIDAFRKFIVRTATKTIAANLRAMDLNFLNILTQLSQSPMKDKVRAARLLTRIEGKKLTAESAWLIEKAKELR